MLKITDATGKVFDAKPPITIVEAAEPQSTYSIAVTANSVQAGQPVTITCRFERVGGAWLGRNGAGWQGLGGPVATITEKPTATLKYTLRVLLPNGEYAYADANVTVTPAPTPTPTTRRRGVGIHSMIGRDAAAAALKAGCRDFCVMQDWDTAVWLCDQMGKTAAFDGKGTVLFREYINYWPSFQQAMDYMRKGWDKRVVRIVTNESEFLAGGNSAEGILRHAALDVAVAREMAKGGEHVALGTFAVGNPDITNPDICKAMYDGYATHWNTCKQEFGVAPVWDQHEYSPDENHIYNTWEGDVIMAMPTIGAASRAIHKVALNTMTEIVGRKKTPVTRIVASTGSATVARSATVSAATTRNIHLYEQDWHETRCKFLFELCGFNLKSGGVLVSSETGIDKGGYGGFLGCGLKPADIARWIRRSREIWKRPVKDWYGNTGPMPKEQAAIFQGQDQRHDKGHWGSYYVEWSEELTAAANEQ